MKCLVIIPAYNEEENIVRVVENLKNNYPMYDYVVINDGSADSTAKICRKYGYELVDHSMALYGVCPECRKHKAEQK